MKLHAVAQVMYMDHKHTEFVMAILDLSGGVSILLIWFSNFIPLIPLAIGFSGLYSFLSILFWIAFTFFSFNFCCQAIVVRERIED